ncbi:MAG: hypothetical protein CMJ53_09310 [Planctomycetaceae bacterium]|nr:hypothetical protein [Planctomycetaceae bacterium]
METREAPGRPNQRPVPKSSFLNVTCKGASEVAHGSDSEPDPIMASACVRKEPGGSEASSIPLPERATETLILGMTSRSTFLTGLNSDMRPAIPSGPMGTHAIHSSSFSEPGFRRPTTERLKIREETRGSSRRALNWSEPPGFMPTRVSRRIGIRVLEPTKSTTPAAALNSIKQSQSFTGKPLGTSLSRGCPNGTSDRMTRTNHDTEDLHNRD